MAEIHRSFAELFHSKLGLASPLRLSFALVIVVLAVALAIVFKSAYWYWAILLAVPLALKLSRNDEALRLYALIDSQHGLSLDAIQFYGVLNGWLVRGERKPPQIEFAESLLQVDPNIEEKPSIFNKRAPMGFQHCRLKDIQRIEHDSDKNEITVITQSEPLKLNLGSKKCREKLIEQIVSEPAWTEDAAWQQQGTSTWRYAPNILSLLLFVVPLMLYGGGTVATAVGWVQVADLPLVDWVDVQKAHRKAKTMLTVCAALSSAFLFLHNNVPPLPLCAIGVVIVLAGLVLAYYSCIIKFKRVVWHIGK